MSNKKKTSKKATASVKKAAVAFALSSAVRYITFVVFVYLLNSGLKKLISNPQILNNNVAAGSMFNKFLAVIAVGFFSVLYVEVIEGGKYRPKLWIKPVFSLTAGIVTAGLRFAIPVVVLTALGLCKIRYDGGTGGTAYYIVGALLDAVFLEFVTKGYPYVMLKKRHGEGYAIAAAVITSCIVMVAAWRTGVIPVLAVASGSLLFCLMYYYTGSLLAPIAAHFCWNIIGGVIFDGVSLGAFSSIYDMTITGGYLFSGGNANLDGSALTGAVNVLLIVVMLIIIKKRDGGFGKLLKKSA